MGLGHAFLPVRESEDGMVGWRGEVASMLMSRLFVCLESQSARRHRPRQESLFACSTLLLSKGRSEEWAGGQ